MKESATFSKRMEKKYIIENDQILNLQKLFKSKNGKFLTDHQKEDTKYTAIENIYFDDPNFISYHDSVKRLTKRFKMRIRTYSQNGRKEDLIFLEIKEKESGQTLKKRVAFKMDWLENFIANGNYPQKKFLKINKHQTSSESLETLQYISDLILKSGYKPILKSNYIRYAYKIKGMETIRITIDDKLQYRPLIDHFDLNAPYEQVVKENQYIVEVKYREQESLKNIPDILDILGGAQKFSKYCFGVYSQFNGELPANESREIPLRNALSGAQAIMS